MTKVWIYYPTHTCGALVLPQKEMQSRSDQSTKKEFKSPTQTSCVTRRPCLLKPSCLTSSLQRDLHSLLFSWLLFKQSPVAPRNPSSNPNCASTAPKCRLEQEDHCGPLTMPCVAQGQHCLPCSATFTKGLGPLVTESRQKTGSY